MGGGRFDRLIGWLVVWLLIGWMVGLAWPLGRVESGKRLRMGMIPRYSEPCYIYGLVILFFLQKKEKKEKREVRKGKKRKEKR